MSKMRKPFKEVEKALEEEIGVEAVAKLGGWEIPGKGYRAL